MSYYKILGFDKEPFSSSPDPEFFYESRGREGVLTNLMIELRLRRGLSIILGDVGTGKTTLCRKLIQLLKGKEGFIYYMVLDPSYETEEIFFSSLVRNFDIKSNSLSPSASILDLKEAVERFLFRKGAEEGKIIVLVIDEAQKLNEMSLECLRVLLNYETNKFKLLQLILLGQMELHSKIITIPNFLDRISFKYALNPLDEAETRKLIEFRVKQAGYKARMHLFLEDATGDIYRYTRGYPRQIAMLCHKALKALVIKNKQVVDKTLIQEIIDEEAKAGWARTDPALLQKGNC
ncbi:AAA family ATPase [candidate division WOR-3 bacterium]|nr:AAA family ATPase [candidate division WOR-3 bacterium]